MRKQLKEASGLITRAKDILEHVAKDDKIPDNIRIKSQKIVDAIVVDIAELDKMREH